MKKAALFFVLITGFLACKKDNPDVTPVNLTIELSHSLPLDEQTPFPYEQVSVTITNLQNESAFTQQADASGKVTFSGITAGRYDVLAAITIKQADYLALTGVDPGADVSLNASAVQQQINVGFDEPIALVLATGTSGNFVIKQVYYAGSDTKDGASLRDQFMEIYNNTDQVLYADGLYIARLWGSQSKSTSSQYHLQANGQMDWSKSVDMPGNIDANKDYVYLRDVLRVPGTGTDYPVQPGESIIIAQNALNHKVPYENNKGDQVTVKNPELTVDLSGADFEAYYGDIPGETPFQSDINNPSVPNMDVIKYVGNDWNMDTNGKDSYVIFQAAEGMDVSQLPEYYEPLVSGAPGSNNKKFTQLPVSVIMDAVEAQPNTTEDRIPKKLQPQYDAGYGFVTGGRYTSQALMRKVQTTSNGRRILQDTNNSSADFVSVKADPRGFVE